MKRVLYLVFLCLLCSCAAIQRTGIGVSRSSVPDKVIAEAKKHLGKPYKYAGNGPEEFDCSGFTCYVMRQFDIKLPRTSKDQSRFGEPVSSIKQLKRGDLVFFGGRDDTKTVGHVGIVIDVFPDNKEFTFIHAASRGVMIDSSKSSYYSKRYICARRVL